MSVRDDGFGGFTVGPSGDYVPTSPVNHVTLVTGDDWQGLYVNGTLRTQGHRLQIRDVFEHVPFEPLEFYELEVEAEWLHEEGSLPDDLGSIPQEVRL